MQFTKPEVSISVRIGSGFFLVLLLMAGLMVIGIVRMAEINQRMERVVKVSNVKVELAYTMKNALRDRAISMHTISLMSDVFDQNEEVTHFNELGGGFITAREKLSKMDLDAQEQVIITSIRDLAGVARPAVMQVVDLSMQGYGVEARALISKQVVPMQQAIANKIDELIDLQKSETSIAVAEVTSAYARARLLMLLLGGSAIGAGLLIAFVVIRNASRQAHLLEHQAMYDSLTRLPNRALLADRLQQTVLIARREKLSFAMIVMDLDRFKEINDTLGHSIGDQVLQQVAARTRACLRESDTVARMGGDEFTILLPTAGHVEGATAVAKKVLLALQEPLQLAGRKLDIDASLGIAMFSPEAMEPEKLMRQADTAMYAAKRAHCGSMVYSAELDQKADTGSALQGELRRAIGNGELLLHYQPKIDFATSKISGVEALVRWQHPELGLLYPDKFISMAEENGLIKLLTQEVLRLAMDQCAAWHKTGLELTVAVNASAISIIDPEFPDQIAESIKQANVPASLIELEVTESAVMTDPMQAVDCIKRLNALGVQVAIDDFGTGYSTMTYLKQLLVTKIKIDKSFVKDMAVNHNDAVIVRSTVELGHNLGLKVIAEGVEDQLTWDQLKALGCDSAQGYYMGRPVAADAFIEWLRKSPWGHSN
jgi:diguanylate cyclase (GGDEF)-like protein